MKKNRDFIKKIFAASIVVLLCAMGALSVLGKFVSVKYGKDLGKPEKTVSTISVDWTAMYPFTDEVVEENVTEESASEEQESVNIYEFYKSVMNKFKNLGENWAPHMPKYSEIVKAGTILESVLSDPGIGGDYTRLRNGYWTTLQGLEPAEIVEKRVAAVTDLNDFAKSKDIPLLYVQPAMKNCKYDIQLPLGMGDETNNNIDNILLGMEKEGIDYVDMRENLHNDYDEHYPFYYRTDHHWKVETGLWAAVQIENELHSKYGFDFEEKHRDSESYSVKTFEDALFGSAGQAVSHFVEDSEDLEVLFPDFDTKFHVNIPDKDVDAEGTFEQVMLDYNTLESVMEEGGGFAYETVLYGNRPLIQIENLNNEDGPKVLMIRDSFACVVTPYLALGCSRLDVIDSRSTNGNFTGSIHNYIEQMKPDVIVMLLSQPDMSYK